MIIFLKEYFDHQILEDGTLALKRAPDYHEEDHMVHLPVGVSVNVVLAIPFLDVNPIAATE